MGVGIPVLRHGPDPSQCGLEAVRREHLLSTEGRGPGVCIRVSRETESIGYMEIYRKRLIIRDWLTGL